MKSPSLTFRSASIRSGIPIPEIENLVNGGYFKTTKCAFETLIDLDSFDTYLANRDTQEAVLKNSKPTTVKKSINTKETVDGLHGRSIDKIERYDWRVKNEMGKFTLIDKKDLLINERYQRSAEKNRVLSIARCFDWISFGVLAIAHREGKYHVMDGQHRLLAALMRSDIQLVPCMVYETASPTTEEEGFISTNTSRKAVATIDVFKAKLVAKDEEALQIDKAFKSYGITLNKYACKAKDLKSIAVCFRMFRDDKIRFEQTLSLASELSTSKPIHEKILEGLFYISKYSTTPLTNQKLRNRILKCGYDDLIGGANEAAAYYQHGGAKVWAQGMIKKLNRNLKEANQFKLRTDVGA